MPERVKLLLIGLAIAGCAVLAFTVPIPTPAELRALVAAAGPAAPVALYLGYSVLTAMPLPRTVFSLAAGLLLGPALGIAVAMAATMTSAVLGYRIADMVGHRILGRYLHTGAVRAVDARLAGGGALAVASLRLIPVVPFAPLSYCCGLSSLRQRPYLLGTAFGSLPGTVAVVVLGDALTGQTPPALIACYAAFAAIGAFGVYRSVRRDTQPATVAGDISG